MWTFILSTESQLFDLPPAVRDDPSNRIREADLIRVAPFYAFKLDMVAERLLATDMAAELRSPWAISARSRTLSISADRYG